MTLTAVWEDMTGSGAREAASVLPKFEPAPQYEYDNQDRVTKATVTVVERKEMPRWKERDRQCEPIRTEWDRFYRVLDAHENNHVAIDRKHFGAVAQRLVGKQRRAAWQALDDEVAAADQENAAYDAKSDHGVNEGATVRGAVQCAPEKVPGAGPAPRDARGAAGPPSVVDPGAAQAKLTASEPNDPLEQEADRVADFVVRAEGAPPAPAPGAGLTYAGARGGAVYRAAPPGGVEQAGAGGHAAGPSLSAPASASIQAVVGHGGGAPLGADVRTALEARMGHDFARVRVHTDARAAQSAAAAQARAYAVGADVVFAAGEYAPHTHAGRRLLAHELAHVVQQGHSRPLAGREAAGSLQTALVQRQLAVPLRRAGGPGASPDAAPPAPAPPTPGALAGPQVEYNGSPLSPVVQGTVLTAEPDRVRGQLRLMIVEHGQEKMSGWVDGLEGALTGGSRGGDPEVAGAPDPQRAAKLGVVSAFKAARTYWDATITEVLERFTREMTAAVTAVLDASEKQMHAEALRYGIPLDPTGNKVRRGGLSSLLPMPAQRKALKDAARDLLAAWRKKDQQKATARTLLTPPWELIRFERDFAARRREVIQQYPVLAAYARDVDKLRQFVAEEDPAANLEQELNQKLDNIAWVRDHAEGRKDQLALDPRLRNAAKRAMLAPPRSVEDRVIEDKVARIAADQETTQHVKAAIGFGLLIISFVPGGQPVALAVGGAMAAQDILTRFEDYQWEEAASGSALDRAAAISQSDPSLFRLGLEIAIGLGEGAVEAAAIGKAVELFKGLGPVVREALAARAAARAARSTAAAAAAEEAVTRLKGRGEVGKRVADAIDRGEFARDEGAIAAAVPRPVGADGGPGAAGSGRKVTGLPDAFAPGESHSITVTRKGNIRCSSPYCQELADSIRRRLGELGLDRLTEEQRKVGSGLIEEAQAARESAAKVAEGSPDEELLAKRVERIERAAVELERETGATVRRQLGMAASGRSVPGETQAAGDRVNALRARHVGRPGYGAMMRECDTLADRIAAVRAKYDKIRGDLDAGAATGKSLDGLTKEYSKLLPELDELDKKLGGLEREQHSQFQLLDEGGELYGKTDAENRDHLREKLGPSKMQADERISDVIARRRDGSWGVTEAKGGDVDSAYKQLTNTIRLLSQAEPSAVGRIDARITVPPYVLEGLRSPEGWAPFFRVRDGGRLEHSLNEGKTWRPAVIPGTRGAVTVQAF